MPPVSPSVSDEDGAAAGGRDIDSSRATGDAATTNNDEESLTARLRAIAGVRVVDGSKLLAALTPLRPRYHSPFLDRVAHSPYSPGACSVFAAHICRELARATAPKRKVYCLDCDNTLWGGAVGEVGAAGVVLSAPFLAVQRRFIARQQRGALLCLVSRNVEADVLAVLHARHAEMPITLEHVVAVRATPDICKSAAVLELASTLCLDPSAFVFVDDSPAECADVATHAGPKGVAVVRVPRDPELILPVLDSHWALDEQVDEEEEQQLQHSAAANGGGSSSSSSSSSTANGTRTAEDAARTQLYRELDARKSFASSAAAPASMDAFVASLNLRVDIASLDESTAERAAQLTDRTNQHNACKWPLGADSLLACAVGRRCLIVDASDRFGHHGLIGLIVMDRAPAIGEAATTTDEAATAGVPTTATPARVLHVRSWMLSCRSLHLGIEHIMLRHAAAIGAEGGATHLGVHWRKSERNEPAAAFLLSLPGVRFCTVADASTLGLEPIEREVMASRALAHSHGSQPANGGEEPLGAATVAMAAAALAAPPGPAERASGPGVKTVQPEDAEAAAAAVMAGAHASAAEIASTPEAAVAAATHAVQAAVDAGRVLTLSELPRAAVLDLIEASERKVLTRRLSELVAKARTGELSRSSTRAQISQYRKRERPEAGLILVPLDSAAAAAVSFVGTHNAVGTHDSATTAPAAADDDAGEGARRLTTDASQQRPSRPGYATRSACALHPETCDDLAVALATAPVALHEWVAAESARTHQLPEVFREVWEQYERRGSQLEHARGQSAAERRGPATADYDHDDDEALLDVETLHARLRRRMRHSMHVMMQDANPESYYKDVLHPDAEVV